MMRKVLIACSDEGVPNVIRKHLSRYEVYTCDTGEEAIYQINQLHPDVLVIFLVLAKIDGLTVLRKVSFKPPVTIALTPLLTNEIINAAENLGVQGLIPIPFSMRYLVRIIDECL